MNKTIFILHGGETGVENENNKEFYKSWVEKFKDDYIPTILLVYFARQADRDEDGFQEDTQRFNKYTRNRLANFILADRDLHIFHEQIKNSDVIYVRGGSSDLLIKIIKPIRENILELIKGKVYVGSSAGVMMLSKYTHSHTSADWKEGLGILPWVSFVHYSEVFEDCINKFKEQHEDKNFEYILLPETEFIKKVV